ncbi:unnamed protein product [Colias eurytheme]|nr:unnamed protein product [Colias eurytheme]
MNFQVFKEWFEKLLVSLENPSKIIMDNAPYHSVQVDKPPTQASKKQEIVSWLARNGVEAGPNLLKVELLELVKLTKSSKIRYVIDELALEHGHEVIRLPPYHCQYNAIELIWAQIKGHAARNNTESPFSTAKMMTLLETACAEITKEDWKKVVEKTKKIILHDFERDVRIDNVIENELIISLRANSSDEDDDTNNSSEKEQLPVIELERRIISITGSDYVYGTSCTDSMSVVQSPRINEDLFEVAELSQSSIVDVEEGEAAPNISGAASINSI